MATYSESQYPITFRKADAGALGECLRTRLSVELIGMKRVGISNFMRFVLSHEEFKNTYIRPSQKHLLVRLDLNDLVARDTFPFWQLMLKRISDSIEGLDNHQSLKNKLGKLFVRSIQTRDILITIDAVRTALQMLTEEEYQTTIFVMRFDRLLRVMNEDLIANLQSLVEATNHSLAYVFTSYKPLYELAPDIFTKPSLSAFLHTLYIKPAQERDMLTILTTLEKKYHLQLTKEMKKNVLILAGGHVQYLHLVLIILHENTSGKIPQPNQIAELVENDERIQLQSEEIWNSLDSDERSWLLKTIKNKSGHQECAKHYCYKTGILTMRHIIFNPLLSNYISSQGQTLLRQGQYTLTKKEQLLYALLTKNMNKVCDRQGIQDNVWPECDEIGVSDWAIDRLVSRLRRKIMLHNDPYTIVSIRGKGFVLKGTRL